ncbi:hypothetical protein AB6D11_00830 [Vibrio splendidus]
MKPFPTSPFQLLDMDPKHHQSQYRHLTTLNDKTVYFSVFWSKETVGGASVCSPKVKITCQQNKCNDCTYMTLRDNFLDYEPSQGVTLESLKFYFQSVRPGYVNHRPLDDNAIEKLTTLADTINREIQYSDPARLKAHRHALKTRCTVDINNVYVKLRSAVIAHCPMILALWGKGTQYHRGNDEERLDLVDGELGSLNEQYQQALKSIVDELPVMTMTDVSALKHWVERETANARVHDSYIDLMPETWEKGEFPDEMMFDTLSDLMKQLPSPQKSLIRGSGPSGP